MDIQAIWLLVLAISAPIGGVIGFFLQLSQLNHEKLKNDMLQLELSDLKSRIKIAEQIIIRATPDEIKTYGQKLSEPKILNNIVQSSSTSNFESSLIQRLWSSLIPVLWAALILTFVAYMFYDVYRVLGWIFSSAGHM
jgi:predicted PurR-regulated permease PerM